MKTIVSLFYLLQIKMRMRGTVGLFLILLILLSGCTSTRLIKSIFRPEQLGELATSSDYLKIHLTDGGLFVLNHWNVDRSGDTIRGYGKLYDYRRNLIKETIESKESYLRSFPFSVPKDKITLIETNKLQGNIGNMAAITIVGVPFSLMSLYCLTNPKACFGSCPTFYALKNDRWVLMSEGFSSSISPTFEKTDVDMLYGADDQEHRFSLKLTNEALETHVIRYVDLLAFPKSSGEQVFATGEGQFYRVSTIVPPHSCWAEEGDFREKVIALDGHERYSLADPENLAQKEELLVTFDNDNATEKGLVIGSRQTLLTTHLFYQVMAYTGNYYGSFVADLENGNDHLMKHIQKLWDKLGGIEVFVKTADNKWEKITEIDEMGPIAPDVHLVRLPRVSDQKITLKIRMTKGLWRIDYLALAKILGEETPLRIKPDQVLREDTTDTQALIKLTQNIAPLVTFPGDQYELRYTMPETCDYQVFLETRGYYLEWMREKWLEEENLKKAAVAFYLPGLFMRKAAAAYKIAEPEMEKVFWESRYVKP